MCDSLYRRSCLKGGAGLIGSCMTHEMDGQTDGSLSTQSSRTSLRLGWESFFKSNVKSLAVGSTFNILAETISKNGKK